MLGKFRINKWRLLKIQLILIIILLSNILLIVPLKNSKSIDPVNQITLSAYDYHIISVNASTNQMISGDWDATPTFLLPPFLVFIVDSINLVEWLNSSDLTQAVKRIPSDKLLYLYDPLLIVDDIPGDNRRSGSFDVKVPFQDTWHLVLYAGATAVPLTFSWHINVVDGSLYEIILYSIIGSILLIALIIIAVVYIKRRKQPEEDIIEAILQEKETKKKFSSVNGDSKILEENNEAISEFIEDLDKK